MRITFLGSGGALTDFRVNYHNNALVYTDEGPVLLDCGLTAVQSMREIGVDRTSLRAVLFTHLHSDHASPESLIFERFYSGPDGLPAYQTTELVAPPDVIAPLGQCLRPYLNEFADQSGDFRPGGYEALCRPIETMDTEIGGVRFRFFRVPHVSGGGVDKPAYGLEIDDGKTRVYWSGDTTLSHRWLDAALAQDRVARVFHECMFMPRFRGTVHTHWEELDTLPDELKARVTLMHYTVVPAWAELGALAGAARRHETFDLK